MSAPTLEQYKGFFRAAPFVADVGLELTHIEAGACRAMLALAPRHFQHSGVVHAGVITTLADHCAGAAAQTMVADGGWIVTAEFKLSLLRGAKGQALRCEARVVKPGRSLMFTEADVYAEHDGESLLVAKMSATMAVTSKNS